MNNDTYAPQRKMSQTEVLYYLKPKNHIVQIVHKQVILYDSSILIAEIIVRCGTYSALSVPRPCKQDGDFLQDSEELIPRI